RASAKADSASECWRTTAAAAPFQANARSPSLKLRISSGTPTAAAISSTTASFCAATFTGSLISDTSPSIPRSGVCSSARASGKNTKTAASITRCMAGIWQRRLSRMRFPTLCTCNTTWKTSFARDPSAALALARLRQQVKDLDVQPDQRDQQREGAVPLHVARRALTRAAFDQPEVEHKVEGGDGANHDAEANAQRAGPGQCG